MLIIYLGDSEPYTGNIDLADAQRHVAAGDPLSTDAADLIAFAAAEDAPAVLPSGRVAVAHDWQESERRDRYVYKFKPS